MSTSTLVPHIENSEKVVQAKNIVGDFESNSPIRPDVILPGLLGPGYDTYLIPTEMEIDRYFSKIF